MSNLWNIIIKLVIIDIVLSFYKKHISIYENHQANLVVFYALYVLKYFGLLIVRKLFYKFIARFHTKKIFYKITCKKIKLFYDNAVRINNKAKENNNTNTTTITTR